jgi:DNA-directed RNA polymerase specialized sigma24 family protein
MTPPLLIEKRENRDDTRWTPSGSAGIAARAAVAAAVRGLAPDHRAALVETFFRGRTVREAARVLGVSPEQVKIRVYYAMRALNSALPELGEIQTA